MGQEQGEEDERSGKSANLVVDRHIGPFCFGANKIA
jgi:hypothetical protein